MYIINHGCITNTNGDTAIGNDTKAKQVQCTVLVFGMKAKLSQ